MDVPGAAGRLIVGSGVGLYEGETYVDGGGSDDPDNLQGMCHDCHSAKTAKEDGRWGYAPQPTSRRET